MRRKAVIETNLPGCAVVILLRVLVETEADKFEYKGFQRFYKFTETDKAKQFAEKYCDIVEIR